MKRAAKDKDKQASSAQLWGWLFATRRGLPSLELRKEEATVGAASECDLVIPKECFGDLDMNYIESCHFKIIKKGEHVVLEDVSKKGTFIDETAVGKGKTKVLAHNSKIALIDKTTTVLVFMDKKTCDMCNYPPTIKDKYAVSYLLGSGGFGSVHAIFNKKSHKGYAMKAITLHPGEEKYAKWEAKILRGLKHPCVISMEDMVFHNRDLYIILELMEGGDLVNWIQPRLRLTEKQTKLIFYQLSRAVEYIHNKGICHRDLKPENILLMERKPETIIKVSDFGVSKNECLQSAMDTKVGTPFYIAPEIHSAASRGKTYTKQVDVWSMGVILFYCLSGSLPFRDPIAIMRGQYHITKPPEVWVNVSYPAQELVDSMLKKDPNQRIKVKHILTHRWLQDKEMQETADRLLGKNKPKRERKMSAPSGESDLKISEQKLKVPEEHRRFSWNLKLPTRLQQKDENKSQPNVSPIKEARNERPLPKPRGVLQFMNKGNNRNVPEKPANLALEMDPEHKESPRKIEPEKRREADGPKVPVAMQYRQSPEYRPPKKTENTMLINVKKNLKPVRKL
ncbi:ovarian-specific serine/threonine-protein kinase Lok-like [Schistocerca gregaria]|uniref:ovarian-specific serine/threonine-protein kinase Lok-like n=1 Tax=Schistocerca gregaria TaxID=7010 RepID=UPI00211EF077|nr:ovarian-specific serine/threonine-protein kinase Lok-like [Schistocerca gregaria]